MKRNFRRSAVAPHPVVLQMNVIGFISSAIAKCSQRANQSIKFFAVAK
jgi:hypothetical protein